MKTKMLEMNGLRRFAVFGACFVLAVTLLLFMLTKPTHDSRRNWLKKDDVEKMRGTRYTTGTVWPLPRNMEITSQMYVISRSLFSIEYTASSERCSDVDDAVERYKDIIFGDTNRLHIQYDSNSLYNCLWLGEERSHSSRNPPLDRLYIHLANECEDYPKLRTSESYVLIVKEIAIILADTQWGIMRGLETFSQLVHINEDNEMVINGGSVEDYPRFPYRGLMIDTARHFIPVEVILKNLEIMSYNKLNVLHWHITDHQSFPIDFKAFPNLAKKGAYDYENAIYSEEDVKQIVEFARKRGIRVIPEIDVPGHSSALEKSRPDLFMRCSVTLDGVTVKHMGTLDPLNVDSYKFVGKIFEELAKLFPDEYIHIGADEVPTDCWQSNARMMKVLSNTRTSIEDMKQMQTEGLLQEVRKLNKKPIVWNDAFQEDLYSKTPTVVEVWTTNNNPEGIVAELTFGQTEVIVSFPWYLDNTLKKRWSVMYDAEPAYYVDRRNMKKVLGGEACMWAEHVDVNNFITDIWPSTSATAERLWSSVTVRDFNDAEERLNNFICALKCRNVHTSPITPGYCSLL